ncbi:MAG: PKD domain-containing protein [Candidatus Lernaella stagnicola]|nr:PKD domain-containing protein [Candidatus Lernaella stagnicola]
MKRRHHDAHRTPKNISRYRKWTIRLMIGCLLALFAAPAAADVGSWELLNQYGITYSNSALVRLSAPSADYLYTASVHQDGAESAQLMHLSTDGGYTWDTLVRVVADPGFCGMFKFVHMILDVQFVSETYGIRGGFGAKDACFDALPEPLCLACIFLNGTEAHVTEDGGETWQPAVLHDAPLNGSINVIHMLDEAVGYAGGQYGTFLVTSDGGRNWTHLGNPDTSSDEWEVRVHDIFFLDDQTGYIGTGFYDDDLAPPILTEATQPQQVVEWAIHRTRMERDARYRMAYGLAHPDNGPKGAYGKIMKTTDGGQSWTVLHQDDARAFYNVLFLDEDNGFAIGESYKGFVSPLYVLLRTRDGGATWQEVNLPPWQSISGLIDEYWMYDINFVSDHLGFVIADGPSFPLARTIVFYTEDGGDTWQVDPFNEGTYAPLDIEFVGRDAWVVGQAFMTMKYTGINTAPVAEAGPDQEVEVGAVVQLDGSASYDLEGDPLTYAWTQVGGESAALDDPAAVAPVFTASQVGEYEFELVVSDFEFAGEPDRVTILAVETADDDTTPGDDDTAPADDDSDATDDDDDAAPGASSNDDDDDTGACGC